MARSHGAYTHDEVYFLNAKFVMMLSLMYYEQDMLAQRRQHFREVLKN